jgi:hypothetical protein
MTCPYNNSVRDFFTGTLVPCSGNPFDDETLCGECVTACDSDPDPLNTVGANDGRAE